MLETIEENWGNVKARAALLTKLENLKPKKDKDKDKDNKPKKKITLEYIKK